MGAILIGYRGRKEGQQALLQQLKELASARVRVRPGGPKCLHRNFYGGLQDECLKCEWVLGITASGFGFGGSTTTRIGQTTPREIGVRFSAFHFRVRQPLRLSVVSCRIDSPPQEFASPVGDPLDTLRRVPGCRTRPEKMSFGR